MRKWDGHVVILRLALLFAGLCVVAILIWQGIAAHGAPDPLAARTPATVASLDIGILVFREGLECILVLADNAGRRRFRRACAPNGFFPRLGMGSYGLSTRLARDRAGWRNVLRRLVAHGGPVLLAPASDPCGSRFGHNNRLGAC